MGGEGMVKFQRKKSQKSFQHFHLDFSVEAFFFFNFHFLDKL